MRVIADDDGEDQYLLQTQKDIQYEAKDRSGMLSKLEPANLQHIADKIHGKLDLDEEEYEKEKEKEEESEKEEEDGEGEEEEQSQEETKKNHSSKQKLNLRGKDHGPVTFRVQSRRTQRHVRLLSSSYCRVHDDY